MQKISIICCCLLFAGQLLAQDSLSTSNFPPPAVAPVVYAIETNEDISIDGKLNEAIWKAAPIITDFFRVEPRQGGKYLYETLVRVVYDKKNLYFGVFCKDSIGKKGIRVQDLRRDFSFGENDIFLLQLDPQNLKRFCVSFQTTPYGNQRDLQVFDGTLRDNDWDALWKVRTSITDSGYYAEFAIPFKSLRYETPKAADSLSWGLTLSRLARREYEQTVFPAIPQSFDPYRMTYAAQLKGLKLPPPSANIRVQPYTLFQADKNTNSSNQTTNKNSFKAGGEIKWAVNPRSVLDITFNTDFAQADVDRAVNNLTRFNVFFPERRQFFLENSGVYAGADITNVKPFFSRTIGLANAQFNADPVPIDAGIRYTDRNKKRTLAGLYVHQRGTANQGGANFGVLRYAKNYGKQNNIGVMLTHRLDEADADKGIVQRNNTTLTIDGFVRPNDDITIQYLATASRDNSNDSIGFAGSFFAGWSPNKGFFGWLTDVVSEKYVPGMGFVFANNTIKHNPGGYYIWRPKKGWWSKWIRRWDPGVFVNWFQNANDLKTQEFNLYIFPVYIITKTNGQIEYSVLPTWQNFNFSFPILGRTVAVGRYRYTRHLVRYETDASKKISLESKYEWGGYYNGSLGTLTLAGRFAPIPHIALTANYERNNFKNFGTTNDDFQTDLYTGGIRLAANPRMQLSGFYQYNTFDKRGRWNVRGSWEFAPLSFLYLVFNESSFRDSPVRNQSFISKLTYLKQF
jgi:Domain of unknown function (DUF5916)/Carbohydrate family 9 binding domain-like